MPRVANEIVERRPEEIMAACKKLYRKKKLREISIKDISSETSLSRPAIYNYFDTKEEIFLDTLQTMKHELESVLMPLLSAEVPFLNKIETVLRTLYRFSCRHPYVNKIYNEMTSEGNFPLSIRIAREIEGISSYYYRTLIEIAKKEEGLSETIDPEVFAFCLDNLFMMMQFSFSCEYYKKRKEIYLKEKAKDDEFVLNQTLSFLRGAFFFTEKE